jgi:3-deoxy-D-manno-octulosonic-acid transferase
MKRLNIFKIIYYTILVIAYIIAIPILLLLSLKSKYRESIPKRFFLYKNSFFDKNQIWFHSCSLGETKSLIPIINELKNKNIISDVNISVVTNTGFEEAKKISQNVKFLPFEIFLPFWIKPQQHLVVMEAELWYILFFYAKKNHTKTTLINARISDRSFHKYLKFKFLYKKIFENIDTIFAQSQKDKDRLEQLGAKNIQVIGNIKTFSNISITKEYQKPNDLIITAGSTHKKEEELIIKAFLDFGKGKLIIVPRHPERFNEVDKLIQTLAPNKKYHRFSQNKNFDSDIILIDKMGELINIYAITDIVILGGAFENIGGHNPIEPAFFNCKIISGKKYFNQKELFKCVSNIFITENNKLLNNIINADKSSKYSSIINRVNINTLIKHIGKKDEL